MPAGEDDGRRFQQRPFKASQEGDLKKVGNLQKLMLRSHANSLLSVRRVPERNAGRKTAGVAGGVEVTSRAKAVPADEVHAGPYRLASGPSKHWYWRERDE